jgi:RNA polymerase sigma-70 factor (ECF subfamily)
MPKRATTSQPERARIDEILAGLSDADLLRLRRFAQLRARLIPSMEWQDLLQEAIALVLDGRRTWPRSVDFLIFMRQTIRSIANNRLRQETRRGFSVEFDDAADVADMGGASQSEPEQAAAHRETLERINLLFEKDSEVLAILAGLAAGESPREIQERSGMTATEYASAQRRIRRSLDRAFPDSDTGISS